MSNHRNRMNIVYTRRAHKMHCKQNRHQITDDRGWKHNFAKSLSKSFGEKFVNSGIKPYVGNWDNEHTRSNIIRENKIKFQFQKQ